MARRPKWRLTIRWVGGGTPGIQLHEDGADAVRACRSLKDSRDTDPRIESVVLFAPSGEAVWDVFKEDEPADLTAVTDEEEFVGAMRTVPYNRPPKGRWWDGLTDYQQGAVTALLATTPTHAFLIGALREDNMLPLWFDGKGEFADDRWLIHPDGTPYREGTMVEAPPLDRSEPSGPPVRPPASSDGGRSEDEPPSEHWTGPEAPVEGKASSCPDGGECHHGCEKGSCWRVSHAKALLACSRTTGGQATVREATDA